jgi:selenocysteine-specific elongation factor
MKSVIIGTAGHIDHGKTALVKALTGMDADRLEEEKRRGITIDIGFAHLYASAPDGESLRLGFVDVPGHERFIRNMLAGIGGIDLVLFVIAADESIKPQTREHFDICRLLGVGRGITVLTKADAVTPETLAVVKLEVEEFVRSSFLDPTSSPIISVSALTGAGLDELKRALIKAAAETPGRDSSALARLPIDRVFTMKGFGTVVTGTLISGSVHRDDELEVFPKGKRARVRGVQVYGQTVDHADAGQRTALNLAGIEKEELERGMVLAPPATFHAAFRADASMSLLSSAKPLKSRTRVHFYTHTSETIAEVVPYGKKQIPAGETEFVNLRFTEPLLLLPGDRFIVRQLSPLVTIGGGRVLDTSSLPKTMPTLELLATGTPRDILRARVELRMQSGATASQLTAETGWRGEFVEKQLAQDFKSGDLVKIGEFFISRLVMATLRDAIQEALVEFHTQNPLVAGVPRETLRERLAVGPEIFASAVAELERNKKIELNGELICLAGRGVVMKDEEWESRNIIETSFSSAGLKVPALKEVLAGLRVDKARAQKIVTLLLRDKTLVKVAEDLVFHQSALEDLRRRMAAYKMRSAKIDVAQFKELTGVSRKYAIPLLEYLDRERITKRQGDTRIIL